MKSPVIQGVLFIILFCFVTSNMVYHGFLGNNFFTYTKSSFIHLYGAGVYQYRILGKWLVLELDKLIDPGGKDFFRSVFYVNTFFLILTGIVTVLLVNLKGMFILSPSEKYLIIVLVPLLINLTQYTVVPYDVSGYFFQLSIIYVFLAFYVTRYILTMVAISLLLILSTLNRESSAISVAFLLSVLILRDGFKSKAFASICVFVWAFLLTYIFLRISIINKPYYGISLLTGYLMKYVNILGILFWLLIGTFIYTLSNTKKNKDLVIFFHILSLPYIFEVFHTGILWEMRLYIPLFLGGLFLSKLDTSKFNASTKASLLKWLRI